MSTSSERRKYARFEGPCRLLVELPGGHDVRTRTLNVSDGGLYFITEEVVEIGHEVTVRLAVPRDTANTFFLEQFAAKARVVRREPPQEGETGARVALEFEKELVLDLV